MADPTAAASHSFVRRLPHISAQRLNRLRRLITALQALSPGLAARVALYLFQRPYRRHMDAADVAWLAQGQSKRLPLGGESLQVYEWGAGQKTALLAHGWGSHGPRFAPLAEALVRDGWRVVAFDAPAHGKSSGSQSNLLEFRKAVRAVLDHYGPAQALIGHSFGALTIMMMLSSGAISLTKNAAKVVLISMPSGLPFLLQGYVEMLGLNAATVTRMNALIKQRFGLQPDELVAAHDAARVHHPILLIHDAGDDIVPLAHSEALLAVLPQARLFTTAGLGHSGLLRDAATIDVIRTELQND